MKRKKSHAEAEPRETPAAAPEEGAPEEEPRDAPEPSAGETLDAARAELTRLRAREEELLRALAELTNVHRRRKQETEQSIRYAQESLLRDLLPVLDDLERALAAARDADGRDGPIRSGVALVRDRLVKLLEREGLMAIRPVGHPFDPTLHDAIATQPAPRGVLPGTVLDVAQAGYRLKDRVLRHAKVVVAGAPPTPSGEDGAGGENGAAGEEDAAAREETP